MNRSKILTKTSLLFVLVLLAHPGWASAPIGLDVREAAELAALQPRQPERYEWLQQRTLAIRGAPRSACD